MLLKIAMTAEDPQTLLILLSGLSIVLGLVNPMFVIVAIFQIVIAATKFNCSHTE